MFFTKNLKNIKLKKKLCYQFTSFFEIKDIVESLTYCLRLLNNKKFILSFIYFF